MLEGRGVEKKSRLLGDGGEHPRIPTVKAWGLRGCMGVTQLEKGVLMLGMGRQQDTLYLPADLQAALFSRAINHSEDADTNGARSSTAGVNPAEAL